MKRSFTLKAGLWILFSIGGMGYLIGPPPVHAQGETTRVSVDSAGNQANHLSWYPSISADGRFVAFVSAASNLVEGDTNGVEDVFVHDRLTGTTTRVSVDSLGNGSNEASLYPSISANGRFVAFHSAASNLVAGDTNGQWDIFVHAFRGPSSPPAGPAPDLKIAGSDGPVTIAADSLLSITVSLDSGGYAGTPADWWMAAATPSGWYTLELAPFGWKKVEGIISPVYQGPIMNLPETALSGLAGLPSEPGEYTFYFAVDLLQNGLPDLDRLYLDAATVRLSIQGHIRIRGTYSGDTILNSTTQGSPDFVISGRIQYGVPRIGPADPCPPPGTSRATLG